MKVSIVTATYNSGKTLSDTLRSVILQTYPDIEYIIVDGGSTDNTLDTIRRYEPQFGERLKWVSEKDRGIYDAMNKGLQMASGEIVGILNSDDYFTSTDVVAQLAACFANNNSIEAVYGDVHFIRNGTPDKCVRYYSSALFHPFWLRFGFMPAHPSFYVRSEVYRRAGYYKTDYAIGADFEMMVRLFRKYRLKALYLKKDFVTMRIGGASTKNLRSRITLLREVTRACRENGIWTHPLLICLKFFYKVFEYKPRKLLR